MAFVQGAGLDVGQKRSVGHVCQTRGYGNAGVNVRVARVSARRCAVVSMQQRAEQDAAQAKKIKVAVLGATGSVGQRFIELLGGHPWFDVVALGASSRSAGKPYEEACRWKQAVPIPEETRRVVVSDCDASLEAFKDVKIVFSGLDNEVAGDIEEAFAKTGKAVFSNAKNHRMDPDVPILIPPVNAAHVEVLPAQIKARNFNGGFLVTNANCSTTVMSIGLKPIMEKFGIEKIHVTTMQAISGAGYPGLPSMDIIDNVVPYIGSEEEKMESESKKIYGTIGKDGTFENADFVVSAMCNRVHVLDGHLEAISLKLKTPATPEQVIEAIKAYPSVTKQLGLPSAPEKDVVYCDAPDRPQTRLDRMLGGGFTVSVGRVRKCTINDIRLVCLGHNTIVGAAGGSIINAELCVAKGLISRE
ncbi:Aspartate-semialdehyde dehydrogenase [Porphyridium purpureum]|uniref:Aspartate-semialdehyde dehydrogenase n=1 Tax=Porphyridium purpureum TaxID=35688 RepID=A0A5J4Z5C1_PORPP|nr:Aspartate-semialdehyde dehydrogenase [Porphyridium purpureum]|eukprot:POR8024..scf295_1